MDQNQISAYAKKLREVLKVIVYTLRKSKSKLLVDLNLALKRGKIAGKSLIGKLSHHHHHHHHNNNNNHPDNEVDYHSDVGAFNYPEPQLNNYVEFSCSNTPAHNNTTTNHHHGSFLSHFLLPSLHLIKGRGGARHKAQFESVEEEMGKAFEIALNDAVLESVSGSPVLLGFGFGRSPAPVRQLRVTDSPFPVLNSAGGDSGVVDAAAEAFIKRFYSQLKRQPLTDG